MTTPNDERLVGREPLAEEDQLLRPPGPDQPYEPMEPARARDDAERDLGQAEDRRLLGDAEVGSQSQLEPAAEAVAAYRSERRLRKPCERLVHGARLAIVGEDRCRIVTAELRQVGSGRERPARPREDDGS